MIPVSSLPESESRRTLLQAIEERVLIIDGAMGTMLQSDSCQCHPHGGSCGEKDEKDCPLSDMLNLTDPEKIARIHNLYLPYADIIETNTFNSNAVSLEDYGLQEMTYQLNLQGARIARQAADSYAAEHRCQRFVAGSIGPSSKLLSMSRQFGDSISFDEMSETYRVQAKGLIDGNVDFLLIETALDLLNVKAAIAGAQAAMRECGKNIPLSFSFTITNVDRILTGTTLKAMAEAVMNVRPISVGMNCGAGAAQLLPLLDKLAEFPAAISVYPNAGLPDELGHYSQTPEIMASYFKRLFDSGTRINIVGGCCGTTPAHIKAIAEAAEGYKPVSVPAPSRRLALAGASPMKENSENGFIVVGERCNVAGSRKFLRLISEKNYTEALDVARTQIAKGAQVLDISMDAPLLDAKEAMVEFLGLLTADPQLGELPVMVDSSSFDVIEEALKVIPGRPVVNSISLKEGEEKFIERAVRCYEAGAAVVIMAFDENGQATDTARRVEICRRSVRLLTEAGLTFRDIVFDPNILTVATGIAEHNLYGKYLLDAIKTISSEFPDLTISGGLSNLSFSFRGNDFVRNAMHSVFLRHAVAAGMRMAIVNPGATPDYGSVPADLRAAIENLLFGKEGATDTLLELVEEKYPRPKDGPKTAVKPAVTNGEIPDSKVAEAMTRHLFSGVGEGVIPLAERAVKIEGSAYNVVGNILLKGMEQIGTAFSRNEIFLPQIVKSAGVMKVIMEYLAPVIERESGSKETAVSGKKKVILATVKGDVHDIGKNIVGIVLRCNGFDVTDLGVMVPPERIIAEARKENADAVAVSGLITPSLSEMETLASMMQESGLDIPLFVGGATTSDRHTDLRLVPLYRNAPVVHTADAASLAAVMNKILNEDNSCPKTGGTDIPEINSERIELRMPPVEGVISRTINFDIPALIPLMNYRAFLGAWKLSPGLADRLKEGLPENPSEEERQAYDILLRADRMLSEWTAGGETVTAHYVTATAKADPARESITVKSGQGEITLPLLRGNKNDSRSIADLYIAEKPIYLFAVSPGKERSVRLNPDPRSFEGIMTDLLLARLTEAATEALHRTLTSGLSSEPVGIRPAVGYPSLPDQSAIFILDRMLDIEHSPLDAAITENGAISPSASTLGLIIPDPDAKYYSVHPLTRGQVEKYAAQRGLPIGQMLRFLPPQS